MNEYIYTPSENAFYSVSLRKVYELNNTWPIDGLAVDDDCSKEFMGEPPEGKIRVAGTDGYPEWGSKPEPSIEDFIAVANNEKKERLEKSNDYMNSKQWPGKAAMGRLSDFETIQYNLWLDYLNALESIDTASAPNIDWPRSPAELII